MFFSYSVYNYMDKSESTAIDLLRCIAILSIIICHLYAYYENEWAQIFNIGVQVLFAISGYLYGKKQISGWKNFYLKRFLKIYKPYIIFVIPLFLIYFYMGVDIKIINVVTYVFMLLGIPYYFGNFPLHGMGHLWFLSAIFICYSTLPVLEYLRNKINAIYSSAAFLGALLFDLFELTTPVCYIWLFGFAYMIGNIDGIIKIIFKAFLYALAFFILCKVSIDDMTPNSLKWSFTHYIFGLVILLLSIDVAKVLHFNGCSILKFGGHFSYYVYLVHMIWIDGALSVLPYYKEKYLMASSCVLILTICSALQLWILSNIIIKSNKIYLWRKKSN